MPSVITTNFQGHLLPWHFAHTSHTQKTALRMVGAYLSTRRLCPSAATSQYVHYERQSGCSWDTHAHYCRLSDREGSQAGRIRRPICLCLNICRGKALSLCLADGGPARPDQSSCLPVCPGGHQHLHPSAMAFWRPPLACWLDPSGLPPVSYDCFQGLGQS